MSNPEAESTPTEPFPSLGEWSDIINNLPEVVRGHATAWTPPSVGELSALLPDYRIDGFLGRGGMGAVYRGQQLSLERPVAIKLLPEELACDAHFRERFLREARTLAKLSHPHIVAIHDSGETVPGHLYFVMEYVEGTDLQHLIDSGRVPVAHALTITSQLCEALRYAHSRHFIHRDIKPSNVLITRDGQVKLADFGLARSLDHDRLTLPGAMMGTPAYMAPEQMREEGDHRADLYALGVLLYVMLTGVLPPAEWRPPSQVAPLDARLDDVVARALQAEPARRYQDATQIKSDVDAIRDGDLAAFGEWSDGVPFAGLASMEARHHRVFFGRQAAERAVIDQWKRHRDEGTAFCLIAGSSGSGKSSLVRAGILPRLTRTPAIAGYDLSCQAIIAPRDAAETGRDPVRALARALLATSQARGAPVNDADLARMLRNDPGAAHAALLASGEAATRAAAERGAVIVIDQLEEIFTLPWMTPDIRAEFIRVVAGLARSGGFWVLATLRSDFFADCECLPELMDLKSGSGLYHLDPPRDFEIAQIVRWTAHAAGITFERNAEGERLDEVILRDARASEHSLPMLSWTLGELHRACIPGRILLFSAYQNLGGITGALRQHADRVWDDFSRQHGEEAEAAFDALFHRLVTHGESPGAPVTRLEAAVSELPAGGPARALLSTLTGARLIVQTSSADGSARAGLAHEALLLAWPRLKTWVEQNAVMLRVRSRVAAATRLWEEKGRSDDYLLSPGLPLTEAQAIISSHQSVLSSPECSFIRASQHRADATARRKAAVRRRIIFVLSSLTAAACFMAAVAWWKSSEAASANAKTGKALNASREAAHRAHLSIREAAMKAWGAATQAFDDPEKRDPRTGLARLAEAIRYFDRIPDEFRDPLIDEDAATRLMRLPLLGPLPFLQMSNHYGEIGTSTHSQDQTRIVTTSSDNTIRVWNAESGKPIGEPMHPRDPVENVRFGPDGKQIASRSQNSVLLWNPASGEVVGEFMPEETPVSYAEFNSDGTRIMTKSQDNTVRLWDTANGKSIGEPMRNSNIVNFNSDGTRILTTSTENTVRLWDTATGKGIGDPMRHEAPVTDADFNSDGTRIGTKSADNTVRLWDAANGKAIGEPIRSSANEDNEDINSDGTRLLTTSTENTVRLWDTETGKGIGDPMPHAAAVSKAQFSPTGARIVTTSNDNTVRLWDAANGKGVGDPMRHEAPVTAAYFNSDGTRIVTKSEDNKVRLWDAANGKAIGEPIRNSDSVNFSPDGTRIVTTNTDNSANLWDAATGKGIGEPMRHEVRGITAQFSSDGARIVTTSGNKTVRLWDAANGNAIGLPMTTEHDAAIALAYFSPDGRQVITHEGYTYFRDYESMRLWGAANWNDPGEPVRLDPTVFVKPFRLDGRRIVATSIADPFDNWRIYTHHHGESEYDFSIDGSTVPAGTLLVTENAEKSLQIWDATSGEMIGGPMRQDATLSKAYFSPDKRRLLTVSLDNNVRLWDAASGKAIGEPMHHKGGVGSAGFSPDGTRVITTSGDGTISLWDSTNGKAIGTPMLYHASIDAADFSPDGTRIVMWSEHNAVLWDAVNGKAIGEPMHHQDSISRARFSPDGTRIVTASLDKTASLWDTSSGEPVGEKMKHETIVEDARFSPDGSRLVTVGRDSFDHLTVRIWDPANGKPIFKPLRVESNTRSVILNPKGTQIITTSFYNKIRLFDAARGEAIGEPIFHRGHINEAHFSADGTQILSTSDDGTTQIWEAQRWSGFKFPPEALELWGGLRVGADGRVAPLSPEERNALCAGLLPKVEEDSLLGKLLSWRFDQSTTTRQVSPNSTITLSEHVERVIDWAMSHPKAGNHHTIVQQAYALDPGHPLVQFALAAMENNETRSAFLRNYGLEHLPPDARLCAKAAEILLTLGDKPRALLAAEKALKMEPVNQAAQKVKAAAAK